MDDLGKVLILLGAVLILAGGFALLVGRVFVIGRLPGDFTFTQGGWTCFLPLASSIILSILLTIALNILMKGTK